MVRKAALLMAVLLAGSCLSPAGAAVDGSTRDRARAAASPGP